MRLIKNLVKVTSVFSRIASASPEIIAVFTGYKEAIKDNKLTFDELLDLFNKLKSSILKICPELEKYL